MSVALNNVYTEIQYVVVRVSVMFQHFLYYAAAAQRVNRVFG